MLEIQDVFVVHEVTKLNILLGGLCLDIDMYIYVLLESGILHETLYFPPLMENKNSLYAFLGPEECLMVMKKRVLIR